VQEERARAIEQALPETERAVVVRVPSGEPVFNAALPQERWVGALALALSLYLTVQLGVYLGLMLLAQGEGWICPVLALPLLSMVGLSVRRLSTRPAIALDRGGLRVRTAGFVSRDRTIAVERVKGFSSRHVRRKFDNAESWHLYVDTSDGRSIFIGKTRNSDEAASVLRGLQDTLATLRWSSAGYRVGS
jgi:hypothetical protein